MSDESMSDTHVHIHLNGGEVDTGAATPQARPKQRKRTAAPTKKATRRPGAGLPKKYAKMGFKKGWREYKKTPAYKRKKKARR